MSLLRRSITAPEITAPLLSDAFPARDASRPCALLFSPHPDDECLTGALPLRLKQEQNWQIINIAVSLGSDIERRATRKNELAKACAVLGFDCVVPSEENPMDTPRLTKLIAHYQPQAIFLPHAQDAHPTHIHTHHLGMEALAAQKANFTCAVIQTEYWQPVAEPNLMIGINENDAALLLSAIACHAGQVSRNPFDARFPAFLIDNVRRGSERVGGAGAASAAMDFAMLYKIGVWKNGKFIPSALNRIVGSGDAVGVLFE